MSSRILVVAAHPDDEVLGCGGTLARHSAAGDLVQAVILAEGVTSRDANRGSDRQKAALDSVRDAANKAADILGAQPPRFCGLPDNRMDELPLLDVVKRVEEVVDAFEPDIVYTHFGGDLNIDHRIAFAATMTACRPLPATPVRAIYTFETVSSTGWQGVDAAATFTPTRMVDVEATLETKLAALRAYTSEMRDFPHARSLQAVEALARHRGASAALTAAEGFVVQREIVR